jgi:hypothetical protein
VACDAQVLVFREFRFGATEVHLKLAKLVLEERDDSHATVDGVTETHVSLIGERIHGVLALVGVQLVQKLRHVACPKHFVHVCKFLGLVRWEIWCKNALRLAFAPQKLARCTWGI